jgi:hypothetical protein
MSTLFFFERFVQGSADVFRCEKKKSLMQNTAAWHVINGLQRRLRLIENIVKKRVAKKRDFFFFIPHWDSEEGEKNEW